MIYQATIKISVAALIALWLIGTVGCKPDSELECPEIPVPFPDCSYNHTTAVVDTFEYPPPYTGWHLPEQIYYEGYEITDISFNPNNANEMCVAVQIHRTGVISQITSASGGSAIVRVDLCTGAEQVIFAKEEGNWIRCLDWGSNDTIVFVTPDPPHSVFTLRSDGSNFTGTQVPYGFFGKNNIKWSSDRESWFMTHMAANVVKVGLNGEVMAELNLNARDIALLPNDRIGYLGGGHIGMFNPATGTSEILYDTPYPSNKYDIAYSAKHNGLIWSLDTLVGLTNIETGQTTILKQGAYGIAHYSSVAATTNGYLIFRANVISPTMSTTITRLERDELRFINADGTDERRLVLDFQ